MKDSKFNADKVFRMLKEKKEYVLATVATGSLNETIAKRAGLVPNHAYALLDLREVEASIFFLVCFFVFTLLSIYDFKNSCGWSLSLVHTTG